MHLRYMNEFQIFYDIHSITFLLYTLKIVILRLTMLLARIYVSDVCLYVLYVYFYVCSPVSYWIWWSHLKYVGSIFGHGLVPALGIVHGLLPLRLGHVEHIGSEWGSGLRNIYDLAFAGIEIHTPSLFPLFRRLELLLKSGNHYYW